jgi:hypothetical protein
VGSYASDGVVLEAGERAVLVVLRQSHGAHGSSTDRDRIGKSVASASAASAFSACLVGPWPSTVFSLAPATLWAVPRMIR